MRSLNPWIEAIDLVANPASLCRVNLSWFQVLGVNCETFKVTSAEQLGWGRADQIRSQDAANAHPTRTMAAEDRTRVHLQPGGLVIWPPLRRGFLVQRLLEILGFERFLLLSNGMV